MAVPLFINVVEMKSASLSLHQTRDQSCIPSTISAFVCVHRIPVGIWYTEGQITDISVPKLCDGHIEAKVTEMRNWKLLKKTSYTRF
jgi:hypothetical protein